MTPQEAKDRAREALFPYECDLMLLKRIKGCQLRIEKEILNAVAQENEECAKVAEDVINFTGSQTQERDWAYRICPKIAQAIRRRGKP